MQNAPRNDRIDHRDPLPGYKPPPPGRWATPYITYADDGEPVHACALRMSVHLSTAEVLAGCRAIVYADTPEALQAAMDAEDIKAADARNAPSRWTETASGPPADAPWRGISGGAAGSCSGP